MDRKRLRSPYPGMTNVDAGGSQGKAEGLRLG